MSSDRKRTEPWPWLIGLMLAAMIGTSLGFFTIAVTNPDPEVEVTRR